MTHNNIDYFVEQQKTNIAKEKKNMDNNPTTVPSKYNVEKDIHQHKVLCDLFIKVRGG